MKTINDHWHEYNLWLEAQGLHDEEAPIEEDGTWIGHPDEWSSGDVPEPPPNFVEEHWEADTTPKHVVHFWKRKASWR